jgi:FKBP-type peptidyl-prolyl cis-trans isomerase FkpA
MPHRILAVILAVAAVVACNDTITGLEPPSDPTTETFAPSLGVNIATMTLLSGVWYSNTIVGTGASDTANTDSVKVNYMLFLKSGVKVDSGTGSVFQPSGVITGFRIGMIGMKEGGKRKVVIKSELGYGNEAIKDPTTGAIRIPRQSTLIYDIELVQVYNPVPGASAGSRAGVRAAAKP